MIRVAAVGDLHVGRDSLGHLRPHFERLDDAADVLLIAGDLTRCGDPEEAAVLAKELDVTILPKAAVLGNHDYHCDKQREIKDVMEEAGVRVLEGEAALLDVGDTTVAVAGTKGFGGGFPGASATDFGEPEMKAFIRHTKQVSERLEQSLSEAEAEVRVVLLHYSPVETTLHGERLEIYPFLGSYLLAEAIDRSGADLVVHGHAHNGSEKGVTPGGIHVRNVAQPVIRHAFNVYCLAGDGRAECDPLTT